MAIQKLRSALKVPTNTWPEDPPTQNLSPRMFQEAERLDLSSLTAQRFGVSLDGSAGFGDQTMIPLSVEEERRFPLSCHSRELTLE